MTWSMTIEEVSKHQRQKRQQNGRLGRVQPDVYEDTKIQRHPEED